MNFKYKKYSPEIIRPVIPIEVAYKNQSVKCEVLVDSGADFNIFDAELADILGIDLDFGQTSSVTGITGVSKTYFINKVDLIVGGYKFSNIEAGFLREMGTYAQGVVGQKGFFDLFVVKFDLKKKRVELKQY